MKPFLTGLACGARNLAWFAACGFASLLAAQEPTPPAPTPTPHPAPTPPVTEEPHVPPPAAERPQPQDPAGGAAPAERPGRGPGGPGRRRGQGPGQGPPAAENQDLPEFTPVAAPPLAGLQGKQYFWFTIYPNFVVQYDPQTDTVVKKVALKRGLFWSTNLTHDRKRLIVTTDQQQALEVIDLATGEVVAEHEFKEEGFILRIRDVRECPGGVHWLVRTERVKKEIDRYSFEPAQWLLYDTAGKKVVRKLRRLPEALDRSTQLSADGTHWLSQDNDGNLLFLDARTFKELGKIDLRTPRHFGAGALRLSGNDLLDRRDPTRLRMLFTSTDPVETRRTTWGVVELDLVNKRIADVVEWGPNQNSFGLRIAQKKLVGVAMGSGFGGGGGERDNRTRLVMFDLRTGNKIAEAFEEFRPRRSIVAISPDGDKVYIGVAGSDFEVFDGNLKRLKTVELEGEVVGRIHVVDG